MSDSEEIDELEHNENVQNISVFRKREKVNEGDDKIIEMDSLKKLNHMLTCPICLDIFQEPVYVKGCSHRFCKDCIEKAIRSSKMKQCPTCRKIIGTKRLLRVDHNVQEIISLIYGDISKFLEQKQTNDELLLSKTYASLNNSTTEPTTRKRRPKVTTPALTDEQPAAIPQKEKNESPDLEGQQKVLSNPCTTRSNTPASRQNIPFSLNGTRSNNSLVSTTTTVNSRYSTSNSIKGQNEDDTSTNNNNRTEKSTQEKLLSSLSAQKLKKRKLDSPTEDTDILLNGSSYKKRFAEDDENGSVQNIKIEKALISISIKVIPYERIQKQFDFEVCKLDWRLTLQDITKLICGQLGINHSKYSQYVKLFTKSPAQDSFYYPLDDRSLHIKNVDDQFWNIENKYKAQGIQTYPDNSDQSNQNRVLYYMIELKELPINL